MSTNPNPVSVFCRFAPVESPQQASPSATTDKNNQQAAPPASIHVAVDGEAPSCTVTAADLRSCAWVQIGCTNVVDPSWTQLEVFDAVAAPVLRPLLLTTESNEQQQQQQQQQMHHAIVAYGQTNCGKTHTILGPHGATHLAQEEPETLGILPRALQFLFAPASHETSRMGAVKKNQQQTQQQQQQQQQLVGVRSIEVACVEIYNESARDLVAVLRGGDFANNSTYKPTEKMRLLRSLQRARCESLVAALELMKRLLDMRRTSSTNSNDSSSRSHIVVRIILPSSGHSVTFCDLAGSECLRQPYFSHQASSAASKLETKNINASLLTLKKVVRSLRKASDHIPFKESMLTAVLEPCFHSACSTTTASGGRNNNNNNNSANSNNRACCPLQIVACCSGYERDSAETLATLRFAAEASAIRPIGMLNPLTLEALNDKTSQPSSSQQPPQSSRSSSATMVGNGKRAASSSSMQQQEQQHQQPSSRSGSAYNNNNNNNNNNNSNNNNTSETAGAGGVGFYHQQQQQQWENINNNETDAGSMQPASASSSAPGSRSSSVGCGSTTNSFAADGGDDFLTDENLNGASLRRVVAALVDENASLRTQIASQRHELDESTSKAGVLMEKSINLIEKYEALQREAEALRAENAMLRSGGGGGGGQYPTMYQHQHQQFEEEALYDQQQYGMPSSPRHDADEHADEQMSTPPPPDVALRPVMVASPHTSARVVENGAAAGNHYHQRGSAIMTTAMMSMPVSMWNPSTAASTTTTTASKRPANTKSPKKKMTPALRPKSPNSAKKTQTPQKTKGVMAAQQQPPQPQVMFSV